MMKSSAAAVCLSVSAALAAPTTKPAADAVNALGIELLSKATEPEASTSLSPYSIQLALVMTFAGAKDGTRDEMAKVLHYPMDGAVKSFAALQGEVDAMTVRVEKLVKRSKDSGGPSDPITLNVANRLFGQTGYDFRPEYLKLLKDELGAPLEELNFVENPNAARKHINAWVEKQTRDRIKDLIPDDGVTKETGLVLVNALYLKAPWADAFEKTSTQPQPFSLSDGKKIPVPTMERKGSYAYEKFPGYAAVALPYVGGDLQFLILLPENGKTLADVESSLTPKLLTQCSQMADADVRLFLPKFKLEPPLFALKEALVSLGMKSAFNIPEGSANFDGIAPRKPDDYLYISQVFHKTFVEIDEQGTEAAAATAVVMMRALSLPAPEPEPIEVRVDRPFLFAIQHRPSGACLFLGRVTDPR